MTLLFLSTPSRAAVWQRLFDAAGERMIDGEAAVVDPAQISAIACWQPPRDLSLYPRLRAVISVGAGVDQMPALPPGVVLSRTLAPGIETMVRDWAVMATLMLHRDMPLYLQQAACGQWLPHPPRVACQTRVGIMGMGRIGRLTAASLLQLGFPVSGWSRSGRAVEGVEVYSAGHKDAAGQEHKDAGGQAGDALGRFLSRSELLICLLPLTEDTRGILDDRLFARLPDGARLVHAGRGAHLDMDALRRALDSGRLAAAMLDVTAPEPLPPGHWVWHDPRVMITPHIAALTDEEEGGRHALAVMRALRSGQPVPGLVDPATGY